MERSLWQLTDTELRDATEDSFRRLQEAEAAYLEHLLELDSRPGAVPGARPGRVAVTFARDKLRRSCAAADVRAAHALAEELPMLGKALAAGEVSREHVDGAVRVLKQIPRHLLDDPEAMGKVDAWFTETSQSLAPLQADKAAKHLLHRLDPDGEQHLRPARLRPPRTDDRGGWDRDGGHPGPVGSGERGRVPGRARRPLRAGAGGPGE